VRRLGRETGLSAVEGTIFETGTPRRYNVRCKKGPHIIGLGDNLLLGWEGRRKITQGHDGGWSGTVMTTVRAPAVGRRDVEGEGRKKLEHGPGSWRQGQLGDVVGLTRMCESEYEVLAGRPG
jgi:hypothetical protein